MSGELNAARRWAPLAAAVLLAATVAAASAQPAASNPSQPAENTQRNQKMQQHPYVGMWVTADGHIRQALLPNGRYDEARGTRKSAYQGRYEVDGNHIDYWDDTGFTADGTFVSQDELHHGGMVFYREK